ncbi:DUF3108 domain-containing protein [Massilia sp. CF038]|uniref:DUF3108 domain-containing protein n=1 Tax=Massilia sp. CF038 TaxID=1881045 RepID=UPI000923FC3F|nr:DUF3108 domain-containing protein [Massilia sp. CF038]SHH63709.1 Protein of unknown function [Massilia sp. CF038]
MHISLFKPLAAVALMAIAASAIGSEHPAIKRAVDLPPSADLGYKIEARQRGITLGGESQLSWRADAGSYSINNVARAQLLGKILESSSEGAIDAFGLAPAQFSEKRYRKPQATVTFDRAGKALGFSDAEKTYPLLGGEQDRNSVQFQLAAVARAAPEKFTPGSEWKFFVAGRRDAEQWVFKVLKRESVKTGMGPVQAVHLAKTPGPDSKDQQIDLWLAPSLEWYPVKLRVSDDPDEFVEQTLEKVEKK